MLPFPPPFHTDTESDVCGAFHETYLVGCEVDRTTEKRVARRQEHLVTRRERGANAFGSWKVVSVCVCSVYARMCVGGGGGGWFGMLTQ